MVCVFWEGGEVAEIGCCLGRGDSIIGATIGGEHSLDLRATLGYILRGHLVPSRGAKVPCLWKGTLVEEVEVSWERDLPWRRERLPCGE